MATNQKSHHKHQSRGLKKAKKPEHQPVHKRNHQQMLDAPDTMHREDVLAAQQQLGNQVVQCALDKNERRKSLTDEGGYLRSNISDTIQQKRGGGSPLPDTLRKDVSKRFKRNFEDVRIHTDEQADQLSRTVNARAFTIGKDIFFKRGVFSPGSSQGRETLMHELTHVVQQSGGKNSSGRLKLGAPDSAHEKQADSIGKQNSASELIKSGRAMGSAVQTMGEEKEELQMQGMEEEEELLQTQEMEEEELQMQEEEELMQPQEEEEEELQMQEEEEEELQMQPNVQGVIQRDETEDYEKRLKIGKMIGKSQKELVKSDTPIEEISQIDQTMKKQQSLNKEIGAFDKSNLKKTTPKEKPETLMDQIKGFDQDSLKKTKTSNRQGLMQEIRGSNQSSLKHVETDDRSAPDLKMTGDEKTGLSKKVSRGKLIETLKDPSKSRDEVEEAKQKLKELHTSKKTSLMDHMFTKKSERYGDMIGERRKALKLAAQKGDKDAYSKWKGEKKFTKGAKFKRGAKKFGSFLGGLGSRFTKKLTGDVSEQLFGKPEKKEEKKEAPAPVAGGGGGGFQMLEKYITENQQLKAKIAELEKE